MVESLSPTPLPVRRPPAPANVGQPRACAGLTGVVARSQPWPRLVRWERRGVFDLALALTGGITYRLLHHSAASILRPYTLMNHPVFVMGLLLLSLLTWGLLATGALAPLARHSPTGRPGELPRGSALWLAAYGLMAGLWLILLFNIFPEAFWGFWHLVRFDQAEADVLAVLVPLALAPGWRRLARVARLAWLHRRRARSGASAGRLADSKSRMVWRHLLLLSPLMVYAWLLRDRFVNDDGWGLMGCTFGVDAFREVGTILLLGRHCRFLALFGLNSLAAIGLFNALAIFLTLGFICWLARLLNLSPAQRRAGWWLAFSTLGLTQMLLGHIEVYPLMELGLVATLVLGLAALNGRCSPAWMALGYALGLACNLSLIFILPAVLLTLWFWARPAPAENRPERKPTLGRAAAHLFGWGALIHLPLWGVLMMTLKNPTPLGLIHAVMRSLNTGADHESFIGSSAPTFWRQLTEIFSGDNSFKMVNTFFFLAAGPLLALLLALPARLCGWRVPGSLESCRHRPVVVLGLAWLGYAFYALTWRADFAWTADWDLFSGVAPLTVLLAIAWLLPARRAWRLPPALLGQVCLFAVALSVTQHYYHHTRASYLNPFGKITWSTDTGPVIQRYQVEHGWQRGWIYAVEQGQVRLSPFGGEPGSVPSEPADMKYGR